MNNRFTLAGLTLSSLLLVVGCSDGSSSSNPTLPAGDEPQAMEQTPSDMTGQDPSMSTDPDDSGAELDPSNVDPDNTDPEENPGNADPGNGEGGDTPPPVTDGLVGIAGLWDLTNDVIVFADSEPLTDVIYWQINSDGTGVEFDYQQDEVGQNGLDEGENCYELFPFTISGGENDEYVFTFEGESQERIVIERSSPSTLSITRFFLETDSNGDSTESSVTSVAPALEGLDPVDFNECEE